MFKNMKLSMKIAAGFGCVLLVAAVLGVSGWYGLNRVTRLVELDTMGTKALETVNQCATLRRDFSIHGFEKLAGANTSAAEQWRQAYDHLVEEVNLLKQQAGLTAGERATVEALLAETQKYRTAFDSAAAARKAKDDAFDQWTKIGWDITSSINDATEKVINPAMDEARAKQDAAALDQWARLEKGLNEQVVQNFLLQRIYAVYLRATEADAQWEGYRKQLAQTKQGIADWTALVEGYPALRQAAVAIGNAIQQYEQTGIRFHQGILASRQAESQMGTVASDLVNHVHDLEASLDARMQSLVARTNVFLVTLVIAGIALGVVLAFLITRSIVKPINRVILGLTEGSEQVTSAAQQVSAASQSLAEGATEQAAGLEETSSSLEEMASQTRQNADNAQQANVLSEEAKKAADNGAESMARMNQAIKEIQKSSDETAKIIKVIDEIAFQTNLLALNAAVEAARAGEAGKGFAVVAEEVRNLAMRSAEAAKNTSEMIEGSVKNAQNGVQLADEVSGVLNEIVASVSKTRDLIGEIAAASREQSQGIEQVNQAVGQMDKVTQANAANAEESAGAAEELNAQAEELNRVVGELSAMVGGSSVGSTAHGGSASGRSTSKPTHKLSASDHAFHQIAKGSGSQEPAHAPARQIPLSDEETFDEFNR